MHIGELLDLISCAISGTVVHEDQLAFDTRGKAVKYLFDALKKKRHRSLFIENRADHGKNRRLSSSIAHLRSPTGRLNVVLSGIPSKVLGPAARMPFGTHLIPSRRDTITGTPHLGILSRRSYPKVVSESIQTSNSNRF